MSGKSAQQLGAQCTGQDQTVSQLRPSSLMSSPVHSICQGQVTLGQQDVGDGADDHGDGALLADGLLGAVNLLKEWNEVGGVDREITLELRDLQEGSRTRCQHKNIWTAQRYNGQSL